MISFANILDTGNQGDLAAGPYLYFNFPQHHVFNYSDALSECSMVIYGGGTLTQWAASQKRVSKNRVLWGTGSTVHGSDVIPDDPEGFDIVGVREWSPEREADGRYVPCVSCMLPWDREHEITREAVLFVNASESIKSRYPVAVAGLPTMENTKPVHEIEAFIGSAEVVVTNSYHGVYWSTLMGRKVVCLPYSSKFYAFKYPPAYSENGGMDWREKAQDAEVYPTALGDCRFRNVRFYARVMTAMAEGLAA